jgi:alkylhydroperoxidase/carboxymuconolactone decarboxylase family protein YurZ
LGATREEILEATAVAIALCGGIAEWPARFVFKVLEELEKSEDKGKSI